MHGIFVFIAGITLELGLLIVNFHKENAFKS